jgi:nicotinamidase-related amidase
MPIPRLERPGTALLVIDVQERLLPTIHQSADILTNCGILMDVFDTLGLPTLVTEQYVRGLGHSAVTILDRVRPGTPVIEKTRFSGAVPEVLRLLEEGRIGRVLLCGVEAHVCVLQTALDLLAGGRQVFLATDAISSGQIDQIPHALARMHAAGAVLTGTLGATYELLADAADPAFKRCLGLVKGVRGVSLRGGSAEP